MAKTKPSWAKVIGPLAEYAVGFRAELFRLGYTPLTAACQIRLTAHLSRWLTAEGLSTQDLDMPTAERYCAVRRVAGYANERTTEALGPLLGYLRGLGVVPLPPASRRRRRACCWTGSRPTSRRSRAWRRRQSR